MAEYIVKDTELTSIANAIRTKGGTNSSLTFPNGFISAVGNIGGGGGGSWQTVFDGSVTTFKEHEDDPIAMGEITGLSQISANEIKVTFNNVEYICEKNEGDGSYGAIYDDSTQTFDWSEYPFVIVPQDFGYDIFTQTAGTHTLKIEEQQSGGSSDFSTAQMTVNDSVGYLMHGAFAVESWGEDDPQPTTIGSHYSDDYGYTEPFSVVMYKGMAVVEFDIYEEVTITATGNATVDLNSVLITGDCTITIS